MPYSRESEYYEEPTRPEPTRAFALGRESKRVQDIRNQPRNLQSYLSEYEKEMTGRDPFRSRHWPGGLDNRHTQAVENLVQRLDSYQTTPSRAAFLSPQAPTNINQETAGSMGYFYTPPAALPRSPQALADAAMRSLMDARRSRRPEPISYPAQ